MCRRQRRRDVVYCVVSALIMSRVLHMGKVMSIFYCQHPNTTLTYMCINNRYERDEPLTLTTLKCLRLWICGAYPRVTDAEDVSRAARSQELRAGTLPKGNRGKPPTDREGVARADAHRHELDPLAVLPFRPWMQPPWIKVHRTSSPKPTEWTMLTDAEAAWISSSRYGFCRR